ncbi:RES family NAD+ phosphorylase [Deinococcus sp. AJ005]|uniref:RES family NAD+ phosphorylase n=1 Tax=Deinococcus sp. AJ005 TaxID=2652443 RepID=UPI0018656CFC|nr:RES family NAD+ phosphorylase [Deinococcus sp. AJ005]
MIADNRYSTANTFEALYTSYYDYLTIKEVTQDRIYQETLPGAGTVANFVFSVRAECDGILDLTDPDTQAILGTNLQELTGDWRLLNENKIVAPTQMLGQVAHDFGTIRGIRYPSKIEPHRANLVIFKARMLYPLQPINLPHGFPEQEPL